MIVKKNKKTMQNCEKDKKKKQIILVPKWLFIIHQQFWPKENYAIPKDEPLEQCKDFSLIPTKITRYDNDSSIYVFALYLKNSWMFDLWKEKTLNMK